MYNSIRSAMYATESNKLRHISCLSTVQWP